MSGCAPARAPSNSCAVLITKSLPPFPHPSPLVADELQEVCPHDKCVAMYDWIGKLKILDEQLALYKGLEN